MTKPRQLTRRAFVSGAAAGSIVVFSRSLRAADYSFTQYHNQTSDSPLPRRNKSAPYEMPLNACVSQNSIAQA